MNYLYSVNDERHFGTHRRTFFFRNSAREYANRFVPKRGIAIRYSADDHDQSFVSMRDQAPTPVWATRYREE